jgi:hypothetical protein
VKYFELFLKSFLVLFGNPKVNKNLQLWLFDGKNS